MIDALCWLTPLAAGREVGSGMADFGGVDAHKLAMAVMLDLGTIAELVERAGVSASAEELHQAIAGSASMGELLDKVEKSTGLGLSDLADLASGLMGKRR